MTKLAEQIQEVDREIDLLLASDETRLAIDEIELAHEQLESCFENLSEELLNRQSLQEGDEGFNFSDAEEAESSRWPSVLSNYDLVLAAWGEDKVKVRQSAAFGDLVQNLEDVADLIGRNSRKEWKEWVESKERSFAVSDAEIESIQHVPEYKQAIVRYRSGVAEFDGLVKRLPESSDGTNRIGNLADRLSEIKSGFDFSLPEYVLAFYKALDDNGSFPLDKVSDKLMRWLTENSALKNLAVVRRGSGGYFR